MSASITKAQSRELFCVTLTSETTYSVAPFGSRDSVTYKNASAAACTLSCPSGTTIDGDSSFTLDGYAAVTLTRGDTEWKATESYAKEELADTFEDDQTFDADITVRGSSTLYDVDGPITYATTTAAGSAFTNQPANDGIEVLSAEAADTTQTVTIIGTTTGTDTVVVETVTLNGTTAVSTTKTNWGVVLALKKSAATAGTVTVREASGNATISAGLTASVLSVGVNTVASSDQAAWDRAVAIVCSGSGTKQIGLKGTDSTDTTIYDSQALTGTTAVTSNSSFRTVTEIYTGDLESNRTATVTPNNAWAFTGGNVTTTFDDGITILGDGNVANLTARESKFTLAEVSANDSQSTTTDAGAAFTNQPANDGVEVGSDNAADTTQTFTVIGTTTGTDTVVVETGTLTGTTFVSTTKTDWGVILAVKLSAAAAGTVTFREASGNQTIIALSAATTDAGVKTVTNGNMYNRTVNLVASGATTKQVGLKGTDINGDTIYDSQALSGTTTVVSNSTFRTISEIYTGDVESSRTATASADNDLRMNGAKVGYNTTAYGVGSAYSLTDSAAAIDLGTTDPAIVLAKAGTYLIMAQVNLQYNGATVAAETATVKVRRTNNTAADLSAVVVIDLPASTTLTHMYGTVTIPPFFYTTSATDDAVTIFGNVSAALSAGTIDATAIGTSIVALRVY